MNISTEEIFETWKEEREARTSAGFEMPGALAVDDVADMLNISIHEVCIAISKHEENCK